MNIHIPKWIFAAIVGAAPMLGVVFLILVSCTLLGIVQRCKINLTKTYANRKRYISNDHSSLDNGNPNSNVLFKPQSSTIIISPFDDIPMKDIDAESSSKAYSDVKDGKQIFARFFFLIQYQIYLRFFKFSKISTKSKF